MKQGVAIDVGAAWHGGPESWERLMEFSPHTIYGFDPQLEPREFIHDGTRVILRREAAWTYYGWVQTRGQGFGLHVTPEKGGETPVRCFDLATFIRSLGQEPIVLKLDCEGAEYTLLPDLIQRAATEHIWKVWCEFHPTPSRTRKVKKIMDAMPGVEFADWRL